MTLPYSDAESSPATERGHKQKIAMKARQSKEIEEATRRALDLDGRRGGLVMVGGSLLATCNFRNSLSLKTGRETILPRQIERVTFSLHLVFSHTLLP